MSYKEYPGVKVTMRDDLNQELTMVIGCFSWACAKSIASRDFLCKYGHYPTHYECSRGGERHSSSSVYENKRGHKVSEGG